MACALQLTTFGCGSRKRVVIFQPFSCLRPRRGGQVYTDGSCFFNTQRTFAIAGFAVRRVAGKKSFLVAKGLVPWH